jgi:glycosyltransferase involved in cell wall biosynthesis
MLVRVGLAAVAMASGICILFGAWQAGLIGIVLIGVAVVVLIVDSRDKDARIARNVRGVVQDIRQLRRDVQLIRDVVGGNSATVAASPSARSAGGSVRDSAALVLASGAFDSEYYAAQAGREFGNERDAAQHFVQYGMKAGLSLHPLFELSYFPSGIRRAYQAGDIAGVLRHMNGPNSRTHQWSPLFDAKLLDSEAKGGSCLLDRFHSGAELAIPLPSTVQGAPLSWLELRRAMVTHAREISAAQSARKEYRLATWDEQAEAEWIAEHRAGGAESSADPMVTIVMPVWNRSGMVERAIESVRAQTLGSWELVVVDDGSTDGTQDVVAAFSRQDSRIRLVQRPHEGVSAARNAGIQAANGRFLAFLDSDNTWRPSFLELMVAGLDARAARAGYAATRMFGTRTEYSGQVVDRLQMLIRNYVDLNVLVAETALIRSIGGFDQSLRRWVDYDLALRILEIAPIEYLPFIGCDYMDDDSADRITRSESANWVNAAVQGSVRRWVAERTRSADARETAAVVRATGRVFDVVHTVRSLVVDNGLPATSVVVVDELESSRESLKLRAHLAGIGLVTVVKLPRKYTPAIAAGVVRSITETHRLLFVREGIELRSGAVAALVEGCQREGVAAAQPIVVDSAGVVVSAGLISTGNGPGADLGRGLAVRDVERMSRAEIDAPSPAAFMVNTSAFDTAGGARGVFRGDAAYIDLLRRVRRGGAGITTLAGKAIAMDRGGAAPQGTTIDPTDVEWLTEAVPMRLGALSELYRPIRASVSGFRAAGDGDVVGAALPVAGRLAEGIGSPIRGMRWAIKIGAQFTPSGDKWGDVPFAASLASALDAHGQHAVVDRKGAFERPTNYLDDVVLVVRGVVPCRPQPGKVNVIWVISRPDLVTRAELEAFDVVFVASKQWCDFVRREWGIDAVYLPQATNPSHFHPRRAAEYEGSIDVLFVGGPRPPVGRQIVADCVELGYDVKVVGPHWRNFVPERMVLADSVPNEHVAGLYASSRIVLNDHWADMARLGFVNNRLYDIVAAGSRSISDDVELIPELFSGAVQTYRTLDELDALLRKDERFPSAGELTEISEQVRLEHSFEERARVIVQYVLEHLRR